MISENCFTETAHELNIELAAIKAVAEVESKGDGFLNGKPIILFEPHIFWRQLLVAGLSPGAHIKGNEDILYPKWGSKPYGPYSKQHDRLERAAQIHREAALSSASWGKFQIMGFNWKLCGCDSLQAFIEAMYKGEDEHLKLFCRFVKSGKLDAALRNRDWVTFARRYNGAGYKKNNYDKKLETAFKKYKAGLHA